MMINYSDMNQIGLTLFQWCYKSYVNSYIRCVYNHNSHVVLLQTGNYFSSLIVLEIKGHKYAMVDS